MKLLKVVAIVVSCSAMAGVAPQWGGGGNSSSSDSMLSIYQYGSANATLQSDVRKSETSITQSGYGNGADVG